MRLRSIMLTLALLAIAGCQTGGQQYYQSACTRAGFTAGTAAFDACVAERAAEMARWNRGYGGGGGGGP